MVSRVRIDTETDGDECGGFENWQVWMEVQATVLLPKLNNPMPFKAFDVV
jgi:hypothetical protein